MYVIVLVRSLILAGWQSLSAILKYQVQELIENMCEEVYHFYF